VLAAYRQHACISLSANDSMLKQAVGKISIMLEKSAH
jgi:hypothetical protein